MLEFFAVFWLCRANRKIAIDRGRRPGGFIALTIVLWVVFEFIGLIAAYVVTRERYPSMFIGLMCAGLGGLISFLITKFFPEGNYVDPTAKPTYNNYGAPNYTNPNSAQVPMNQPAYMYNPNMYQPVPQQPTAAQPAQPAQPASPFVPLQSAGTVATETRYCKHCGSPNNGTNRFCEYCGQNIE